VTNSTPVRIGIQLPEVERVVRWPEYAAMAKAAEEVGFDSIWLGDHLLYRGGGRPERGPWEAFTSLAALAAITERVVLGPLVACAGFHPPAVLAKMAASIDEVSGGRFVLGLGAGWNRAEFDAFGIPFDHRVDRFQDAYTIIQGLTSGQRVTHAGQWWSADDAVLLPTAATNRPIPLLVGSNGERVLRITLPTAHSWNTWFVDFGNRAEGFAPLTERVSRIAVDVGRDPATLSRSACVLVAIDGSDERPLDAEAPPITGSSSQIAATLREIVDAGADELIIVADPINERSIRQLGEVAAALRV
jgi:probable F420-dependent oxidoreductase